MPMTTHLKVLGPKHRELFPSFAPPETWRTSGSHIEFDAKGNARVVPHHDDLRLWKQIRMKILERDNHTCRYCGFRAFKWQVVHHIDGNPENNARKNLETICCMCNMVLHCGLGATVLKIVDLYQKSRYSQAEVIQKTRILRASGYLDREIVKQLGLVGKAKFKQDRDYLERLVVFVSNRKPMRKDFSMRALNYGYDEARKLLGTAEMKVSRKTGWQKCSEMIKGVFR
jgi:hypothetical protein